MKNKPVQILPAAVWEKVATGDFHSLAIKDSDSTLWVWGDNTFGHHSMVVNTWDNNLWGWGANDSGQVGDGTTWRAQPGLVDAGGGCPSPWTIFLPPILSGAQAGK